MFLRLNGLPSKKTSTVIIHLGETSIHSSVIDWSYTKFMSTELLGRAISIPPFHPTHPFLPISSPFHLLPLPFPPHSHFLLLSSHTPPKAYQNCLEQNSSQNVSMFPLLLDITSHPLTLHLEVITYEGLWGNIAALNPETWIFHKLISGDLGFKKLKLHQKYPTGSSKHWKLIKIVSLSLWLHWNIYHVDVQAIHYGYLNVFLPIIISVIQRERDRSFSQAPNQHDFYMLTAHSRQNNFPFDSTSKWNDGTETQFVMWQCVFCQFKLKAERNNALDNLTANTNTWKNWNSSNTSAEKVNQPAFENFNSERRRTQIFVI